MRKIAYTPELLTQLYIVKKATLELVRLNEDKSREQIFEEIETIKKLLDEIRLFLDDQEAA